VGCREPHNTRGAERSLGTTASEPSQSHLPHPKEGT
jgi:hypothetical protein